MRVKKSVVEQIVVNAKNLLSNYHNQCGSCRSWEYSTDLLWLLLESRNFDHLGYGCCQNELCEFIDYESSKVTIKTLANGPMWPCRQHARIDEQQVVEKLVRNEKKKESIKAWEQSK
jgi:hypothetical protein